MWLRGCVHESVVWANKHGTRSVPCTRSQQVARKEGVYETVDFATMFPELALRPSELHASLPTSPRPGLA